LVSALQSVVSRSVAPVQPAVVSVTQLRAGDTWNVIPGSCTIRGTTRWFDEKVGTTLEHRITQLSSMVARGFDCEAQVRYERRLPATINDADCARIVRTVAKDENLAVVECQPSMGSED